MTATQSHSKIHNIPPIRLRQPDPVRVLVAEADDELRARIVQALIDDGYDVVEATNGAELAGVIEDSIVRRGREIPPDVIVTDVRMPGGTAMHGLALLRKYEWNIPVVLMTAHVTAELYEDALLLGADQVLEKPFELEELRTLVAYLVR